MIIGAVMNNVAVFQGESSVMFTSYVPMPAKPHFYLGLILFAVGALVAVFVFFGTLVVARQERTYEGSVPLVTFGAITAAIIAVWSITSGAIALVPAFFWSIGLVSHMDSLMYRVIWWGLGHSSQQVNVAAHVSVWYLIAALVLGAKPLSEKVSRTAFLLYIAFLQLASAHHILVDPGVTSEWKIFNTSYAMYLAVLGSMIHGLSIPGAIEAAQRRNGFTHGVFEWLRKGPWGNPAFAALVLSVAMFGIAGGITGVVLGAEQLNLLMHNTLYVPGHFHATVVAGTTLAFMGITYPLVPLIFRREIVFKKVAQWQPYLFGIGALGISMFMMGAGTLGVSRRNWDIAFYRCARPLRLSAGRLPDARPERSVRHHGDHRRHHVRRRHRLLDPVRGQARRGGSPRQPGRLPRRRDGGLHLRRRGDAEAARHRCPSHPLLRLVRAVLLHQLEILIGGMAASLNVARERCNNAPVRPASCRRNRPVPGVAVGVGPGWRWPSLVGYAAAPPERGAADARPGNGARHQPGGDRSRRSATIRSPTRLIGRCGWPTSAAGRWS